MITIYKKKHFSVFILITLTFITMPLFCGCTSSDTAQNKILKEERNPMIKNTKAGQGRSGRKGLGDGSGRTTGRGRFQDGSGPLGNTSDCPNNPEAGEGRGGRKGLGDGSGRTTGRGRFQDGSGPLGDTENCPNNPKAGEGRSGRKGLGDGSGQRTGQGRRQDGSGPLGDTSDCPKNK